MLESYRKRGNEDFSRRRPTEFNEIIESIAVNCDGPRPTDWQPERPDVDSVALLTTQLWPAMLSGISPA